MKKNILFVLPSLPWPLHSGGNQAMFNGIASLKGEANLFLTFKVTNKYDTEDNIKSLVKELGGEIKVFPFIDKVLKKSKREWLRTIYDSIDYHLFRNDIDYILDRGMRFHPASLSWIDHINCIIKENNIDIVQAEMLSNITIANSIPFNVRKVFVHHELGYIRKELELKEYSSNLYYKSLFECYKIEEIGLLNKYDDIIVLNSVDNVKLEKEGVYKPIHPSFAVVKPFDGQPLRIEDYHNIVFIGSPRHRPNLLAINWFLENCWDKLISKDKSYKLKIIGDWEDLYKKPIESKYSNIIFTGFVQNLYDELNDGIMIVPITVGSGIRMKILEAANFGIPVVSTTVGAEGLPLEDGVNAYISDTPEGFVDRIFKLREKEIRKQFVSALWKMVRDEYSIEALTANRKKILGL